MPAHSVRQGATLVCAVPPQQAQADPLSLSFRVICASSKPELLAHDRSRHIVQVYSTDSEHVPHARPDLEAPRVCVVRRGQFNFSRIEHENSRTVWDDVRCEVSV